MKLLNKSKRPPQNNTIINKKRHNCKSYILNGFVDYLRQARAQSERHLLMNIVLRSHIIVFKYSVMKYLQFVFIMGRVMISGIR